jgi:hypothetical protein
VTTVAAFETGAAEREVLVLRGRGSPPPVAAREAAATARVVAGERFWLFDEGRGRLVACRLERTTRVGERRIRCAEREFSAGRG